MRRLRRLGAVESRPSGVRPSDAGQAALVVVVTAAVLGAALMSGLVELGSTMRERTHAQAAADAAALASLVGGRSVAVSMAMANGATVVSWSRGPGADEVTVVVQVGDSVATARASNAP